MKRKQIFGNQGWYSLNPEILKKDIEYFASLTKPVLLRNIRGIIAPHAGYDYCLQTAIYAYRLIKNVKFDHAIVLGPSHQKDRGGKAVLCEYDFFETPFGDLEGEPELSRKLLNSGPDLFVIDSSLHLYEHSLEMQFPLLKYFCPDTRVLPVILPAASKNFFKEVAEGLVSVLSEKALVVISTDLAHFPSESLAVRIDVEAMEAWKTLNCDIIWDIEEKWEKNGKTECVMCGIPSVITGFEALNRKWRNLELMGLHHSTSADTSGDREKVVGYGSAVIYERNAGNPLE